MQQIRTILVLQMGLTVLIHFQKDAKDGKKPHQQPLEVERTNQFLLHNVNTQLWDAGLFTYQLLTQ